MSNAEYGQQYMQAMAKLHGKRTCKHPKCSTVTLQPYCKKHRPHTAPVPKITHKRGNKP